MVTVFWDRESRIGGRVAVFAPGHPKANGSGYVLRYRAVMERHLGRYLRSSEEVHHINQNSQDDRLENLRVMSKAEHCRLHGPTRRKLDYQWIRELRAQGLGYKRIARATGYPLSSVGSACGVMGI